MAKDNKPVPYKLVDLSVEWTYERAEGDIVVLAETAVEALRTIRLYGFLITDPTKLKQTTQLTSFQNHIKKEGIS